MSFNGPFNTKTVTERDAESGKLSPGIERHRFADIAIDREGTIFIGYRDSSDGSVKVAVGHPPRAAQSSSAPPKAER